jgi:NAD(P)-dependent dehydrogenase (short-subunit alcohol dehydrogenase family)
VVVFDRDGKGAAETAKMLAEVGGPGQAVEGDVSIGSDVRSAVERTRAEIGSPAILVNNAGISRGGRVSDISEDDWDLTLAVNLRGTFLFCKYVVPMMVEARYGRIVNISSGTAVRVGPGTSPYAASKAGIIALTKSIAGEVATRGVTANVVAPGITDTAMTRATFGDRKRLEQEAASGRIANPMRAVIEPEDIAAAVAFLAGPEARYITGQTLHVNAGSFMP